MKTENQSKNKAKDPLDIAVGDILGTVNCLKCLGESDRFLTWIARYHKLSAAKSLLFDGYKFTIEILVGMLCDQIATNQSLHLSEDDLFSRARFAGISYDKLPNSCDKSILIRNIRLNASKMLEANTWETLAVSYSHFREEILLPLDKLRTVATVNPKFRVDSLNIAVEYSSMFVTYIFLNDTDRGFPHGYLKSLFDDKLTFPFEIEKSKNKYFARVFGGFKYAVQFLWSRLLRERFNRTVLAHLHEAKDWSEFDNYFSQIQSEIIEPLEEETGTGMGFDFLVVPEKGAKKVIQNLLEQGPPEAQLSKKEQLDRDFQWYPIMLIDGSALIFGGVAAFVPLLIGSVRLRRSYKVNSQLKVIRFIHGSPIKHRRDYSYGILIEVFGMLSDASGWLLFYDCCSDAGATREMYERAEHYINRYLKQELITVAERSVDKKELIHLIGQKLVSSKKQH